jgi:uncharacterized RDD family membrane protein YckC/uncharacterized membrane protein YhaH (DUF805 family)
VSVASSAIRPANLRRTFVTPEGVDLRLELGAAGSRAGAFLIDVVLIMIILIAMTFGLIYLVSATHAVRSGSGMAGADQVFAVVWLVGAFVLRNGWFSLFEMGSRGATPGKRLLGMRVVARDGARLTGAAVIVRNAMREIEVFLPLSFLASQSIDGTADTFLVIFALLWSGIFLFFPLFNRDRLRVGDLVAGTWVVKSEKRRLLEDLVGTSERVRRRFPTAALNLYGVFELQTLETVLRNEIPEAVATVAQTIRSKAGLPDDGDDYGFLSDYYAALSAHLLYLGVLIPALAVAVRRLHDTNRSGWWLLAPFIPYGIGFALMIPSIGSGDASPFASFGPAMVLILIGAAMAMGLFVFMLLPGTKGPNRFGPDPYDEDNLEEVFA